MSCSKTEFLFEGRVIFIPNFPFENRGLIVYGFFEFFGCTRIFKFVKREIVICGTSARTHNFKLLYFPILSKRNELFVINRLFVSKTNLDLKVQKFRLGTKSNMIKSQDQNRTVDLSMNKIGLRGNNFA